jgi:hypothetical protein
MTAQPSTSPALNATLLNATPLSLHVLTLFQSAKVTPQPGLLLASLALWATETQPLLPAWAQAVEQAVARAESLAPAAAYEALATPSLLGATTLVEAADLLLARLADLIPADTQPA